MKHNNGICPFCEGVCSCTRCLRNEKMNKLHDIATIWKNHYEKQFGECFANGHAQGDHANVYKCRANNDLNLALVMMMTYF